MAQRRKQKTEDVPWSTYSSHHIDGLDFFYEATFDIQCVDYRGDNLLEELLSTIEAAGGEIIEDMPGRVTGGTTEHRIRLKFPAKHTMQSKMTRNAGRRPKHLNIAEGSLFKNSTTVAEFLEWFDVGDNGKGHTDAEGMEQLGIASKSTFRRWVKRARDCEPDRNIISV